MPQKHTQHSCVAHPMYPELYKCNSWESTFVEFCVDGINLFVENNFIDSLGTGRELFNLRTRKFFEIIQIKKIYHVSHRYKNCVGALGESSTVSSRALTFISSLTLI